MSLKTKQDEQFMILMTHDNDINYSSLKQHCSNIIVAHKYDDILQLVETTQFSLILIDLTVDCSAASVPEYLRDLNHPWQSELIACIKAPPCINNQTPIIAIINPTQSPQAKDQYLVDFDDCLTRPIMEEQLNRTIRSWKTKTLSLAYIQTIRNRTHNNHSLTVTIFKKLFEELPKQIIDIKEALENKHYDLAQEVTHKLHGSVSFCGLIDIQQQANVLESCFLNHNYAVVDRHFLELQQRTLNFVCLQQPILANLDQN
jgi:HPt (histidine-containing phosphotransfer) domain-containing protein